MARICPLFSGSSGNSYFVGSADAGILIDIGRSAKQIQEMLSACDIPIGAIKAIFLTHEHTDHIKGLRVFTSKYKIPVFSSQGTLQAAGRNTTAECRCSGRAGRQQRNWNVRVCGFHPFLHCMTARRELGFILQLRMTAHCRLQPI